VEVPETGNYQLETVFTMARDYGIVQLYLNQQPLGQPLDLFNESQVISTGVLTWGQHRLDKGTHQLTIQLVGSHPQAVKSYMVGLDYVRLTRVTPADGS